tara:strand:+ start:233 stop:388 length:156 start_codon:yes stop_codon:yes gene_type:complete
MDTQDLRIEILESFDKWPYKNKKDYIINSLIKFLPQSQLEELKDSIDREIF